MEEKDLSQEISFAEEINRQYSEFIKELQRTLKLSVDKQKDLAKKAGVNTGTVSKLIKHGTVPTFENLYKILYAYLDRSPIDLTPTSKIHAYHKAISQIKSIIFSLP